MQRTGETYLEYQERTLCENSSKLTNNIVSPKCFDGGQEYEVKVSYNDVESDTLRLCESCMNAVKTDARRFKYEVNVKKLEVEEKNG